MTNSSYELDLRDLMDVRYGVWTQRTGVGVGTDIGPAINDGLTTLRTMGGGKIKIPPGLWLMNTPVDRMLLPGNIVQGIHSQISKIVYNNPQSSPFWFFGNGGHTGGGLSGLAIMLENGLGNTNAYAVLLNGDAQYQADQTMFSDLYITAVGGSSYWWDGFHADGSARASPQGVRVASLTNVQIFNCRNIGFYGANIVQWTLTNVGCYTGLGVYGNAMMVVGGSAHVYGMGCNFGGLYPSPSSDVMINGTRYS